MDHREANLKKKIWKYAAGLHAMAQAGSVAAARLNLGATLDGAVHDGMMASIATCYYRPFTNNNDVGGLEEKLVRKIDENIVKEYS